MPRNESKGSILLIDDEPDFVVCVRYFLEREGFRILSVNDGQGACDAVREFPPDLVVLDLSLPDIDGLECMRRLQSRCDAPIVIMSGSTDAAKRAEASALGAVDYLIKPLSMDQLALRIKRHLRKPMARK